jgi:hypothetical protein
MSYNHPQTHLPPCARCGAAASRTNGEKFYRLFCPDPNCFNVGIQAGSIPEVEQYWTLINFRTPPTLQNTL